MEIKLLRHTQGFSENKKRDGLIYRLPECQNTLPVMLRSVAT